MKWANCSYLVSYHDINVVFVLVFHEKGSEMLCHFSVEFMIENANVFSRFLKINSAERLNQQAVPTELISHEMNGEIACENYCRLQMHHRIISDILH